MYVLGFGIGDWLNNSIAHWADNMLDAVYGQDMLSSITDLLSLQKFGAFDLQTLWRLVDTAFTAMSTFGIAMVATYFLMYMFDAAAKEQITVDSLIKTLIQLTIVTAVIGNLKQIVNALLALGDNIYTAVHVNVSSPGQFMTGKEIVDRWLATGTAGFTIFLESFFLWLVSRITIIAVNFAAISRFLELGWRIAFAPIGVANCFEGGASSPAIKYLKGILAIATSGAAIFVVALVGFSLSASLLTDPLQGSLIAAMAAMLATAGAAIGISGKIKEVFT